MKQYVKSYLNTWHTHTTVQLATHLVLAGTYAVMMIFLLVQNNFSNMLSHWGDKIQMDVFLKDQASHSEIDRLKNFLNSREELADVKFVSKDSAAQRFQEQMGHQSPKFFSDPQFGNPLPASFEVILKSDIAALLPTQSMEKLAKELLLDSAVEDVSYGQDWIQNYSAALNIFSKASYFLVFALFSCGLLVVGNAIRSSVFNRREEIEIYELVGATRWAIRAPFVIEGAITGLIASVLALGLSYFVYLIVIQSGAEQVWILDLRNQMSFFTVSKMIGFVVGGGVIGSFGAWVTLRQLATGWSAAERAA